MAFDPDAIQAGFANAFVNSNDGESYSDDPSWDTASMEPDDYDSDSSFNGSAGGVSTIAPSMDHYGMDFDVDRQAVLRWVQEQGLSDENRLARRIACIARLGLIACPQHGYQRHHQDGTRRGAQGLSDFVKDTEVVMRRDCANAKGLGIGREGPIGGNNYTQDTRIQIVTAKTVRQLACGIDKMGQHRDINLEKDHQSTISLSQTRFDVDSFINVIPSIAQFKHSIKYTPVPQRGNYIHSTIHIRRHITAEYEDTQQSVPLHSIPHIFFGVTQGYPIYLFLPGLYWKARKRQSTQNGHTHLEEEEYRFIYDRVFYPALERVISTQECGHVPSSFQDAVDTAKFSTKRHNQDTKGRLPAYGFDIAPEHFRPLQDIIGSMDPDEQDFCQDMFFVLDQKNTKLKHGGSRSASVCIRDFWANQSRIVDKDEVYRAGDESPQLIDLAAEWAPSKRSQSASILLARHCCQMNTLRFLYGDNIAWTLLGESVPGIAPPATDNVPGGSHHEYYINHLRDTCSITSEPTGPLLRQGLYYYQSYTVGKERILSPGKNPYSLSFLVQGGWDDAGLSKMLHTPNKQACRRQIDEGLRESNSFIQRRSKRAEEMHTCWRGEWRCSSHLAELIGRADDDWIREDAFGHRSRSDFFVNNHQGRKPAAPCSKAFYAISSSTYWGFVRATVATYVLILDLISVSTRKSSSTVPKAAQLYAVFVTLLKTFINPIHPSLQYILDNPTGLGETDVGLGSGEPRKKGLGVAAIRNERGFGFLPPDVADWGELRINAELTSGLNIPGYQTSLSKRSYDDACGQPETLFEELLGLLEKHWGDQRKAKMACELGSYLLLRGYRQYVLERICLGFPVSNQSRARIERDDIPFTFDSLRAFGKEVDCDLIRSGNNRTPYKSLDNFWAFTWGELPREREEGSQGAGPAPRKKRPLGSTFVNESWKVNYSTLVHRIGFLTRSRGSKGDIGQSWFEDRHRTNFFAQHSAFPFPGSAGSIVKRIDHNNSLPGRCLLCFVRRGGELQMARHDWEIDSGMGWEAPVWFKGTWTVERFKNMVENPRNV
ncbi:hypothetical protein GQ607_017901 [Colletotrichum asianum]|uniref:Uncharacterized protein n=1 Tax=Colletotrichum asianum TaxID=702518 RepID=A0A8H3ZG46_9PEZI|nr:hypothetical protein GQ607_017901 [Colletotrichum asianum]